MASPHIHVWCPGINDFKGGIQVYSGFLVRALQAGFPESRLDVHIMHDRPLQKRASGRVGIADLGDEWLSGNRTERGSHSTIHPCIEQRRRVRYHSYGAIPERWRKLAFATGIIQASLRQRPDLILTTHLNYTPAARWLQRFAAIPYWTIAHGFEAWDIQPPSLKAALLQADRILPVSHYTRDRLLHALPLHPDRVVRLPNTFDADRFRLASKPPHLLQRYGLRPEQPVLLTVNRLVAGEPFHSYDCVLAALPTIRHAIPDVHYLIVGKGGDRPRLEQLIAQQGLQTCVTLTGFVPDEELPDYYNLCDVFAMPSKLEGFGIVFLEALASGKPTLGGLDGARDALEQGKLGVVVDPDDEQAIAHHLIQLLQKTHPNSLLFDPEGLRRAAIDTFGFAQFQSTLVAIYTNSI